MLVTPAALAAIQANFNTRFQAAFMNAQAFASQLVTEVPGTSKKELFGFMDRIPKMRKWTGDRQFDNLVSRVVEVTVEKYEAGIEVDIDDIEDDKIGVYNPRLDMLGMQAKKWVDQLFVEALQAGDTTEGYDGQYFFDTDHPQNMDDAGSPTQANKFTGKALSATTYGEVRAAMMSFKGADGQPLGVMPDLLVVPPQLEATARQILNNEFISTGGTNEWKGSAKLLVIPELAGEATTWYLLATSWPIRPFVFVNRKAPVIQSVVDPNGETAVIKDKYLYGVKARGAVSYGPWFLAAQATA